VFTLCSQSSLIIPAKTCVSDTVASTSELAIAKPAGGKLITTQSAIAEHCVHVRGEVHEGLAHGRKSPA
jgi:hypothetical protein